jgi:hypothetical protein
MALHLPIRRTEGFLSTYSSTVRGSGSTAAVYEAAQARGQGHAAPLHPKASAAQTERNHYIRSIRELGRRAWHTSSGYSRRSLVENTVVRYRTIISQRMWSRTLAGQRVEVQLACWILGGGGPALTSEPCTNAAIGAAKNARRGRKCRPESTQ